MIIARAHVRFCFIKKSVESQKQNKTRWKFNQARGSMEEGSRRIAAEFRKLLR